MLSAGVFAFVVVTHGAGPEKDSRWETWDPATSARTLSSFLPFDMPAYEELVASEKKVFPHWHLFKVSWDNKAPEKDFYDRAVAAPHSKYPNKGRQRPLPRPVRDAPDWMVLDMMYEIRLARAIGCDGFLMNHFGRNNRHVRAMLEAAKRVGSEFRILLAKDAIGYHGNRRENTVRRRGDPVEYFSAIYEEFGPHPYAYRVGDRLAISGFASMGVRPDEWRAVFRNLNEAGIDVYFVPIFMNWKAHYKRYAAISEGFGDWGGRRYDSYKAYLAGPDLSHALGKKWIMPVPNQDVRVKGNMYWEARGSALYRNYWKAAIESDSDWVQLITWNDYSEATEILPSTGTQYAFYDMSAYYIVWFKTGERPRIVRDVLYYFHRTQFSDANPSEGKQFRCVGKPADIIELVAFLKKPGTLAIEIGGRTYTKKAGYGVTSFTVPLQHGRPVFKLIRDGAEEIILPSAFSVPDQRPKVHDLLYHAGSSTRDVVPMSDLYKRFFDADSGTE